MKKSLLILAVLFSTATFNSQTYAQTEDEAECMIDPTSFAFFCMYEDYTVINSTKTPSGACAGPATACSGIVWH